VRKEKELKSQRAADERAMEARRLAGMGYGVEEIVEELERIKMVCIFERPDSACPCGVVNIAECMTPPMTPRVPQMPSVHQ